MVNIVAVLIRAQTARQLTQQILLAQQLEERKKAMQAYIKVYNMLYEGTNVTINNVVYSADTKKCVMIKNVAGRIIVQNLQG